MIRLFFAILAARIFACECLAQQAINYRPKVAEFGVENIVDYTTTSNSENQGTASSEISRSQLIKTKLTLPLCLKDNKKCGIQLKYYEQQLNFDVGHEDTGDGLLSALNNKRFTSTGLRLFYQKNLSNKRQFKLIAGSEMSSDIIGWNKHTTNHFISGFYSWKTSKNAEMGTGLAIRQVMGLTALYPVFIYKKNLNPRWTLNLLLPKSASIRYNANNSNFLIAKTKFRGWRYNLSNGLPENNENLTIRRADLQFSVAWEREIYDWLWFSVDVGYNKNLRYYITEFGQRRRDAIADLRSRDATYTKFSIFLVPPKKFYK